MQFKLDVLDTLPAKTTLLEVTSGGKIYSDTVRGYCTLCVWKNSVPSRMRRRFIPLENSQASSVGYASEVH